MKIFKFGLILTMLMSFFVAVAGPVQAAVPGVVTNVKGFANNPASGSISLTWGPPAAGVAGITAYQVTVSPPMPHSSTPSNPGVVGTYNGEDKLVSLTTARWTNNVTFPGLSAGVYDFTIAAVNADGVGTSTPVQVTLAGVPGVVTNVKGFANSPASGSISLTWGPPAAGVAGITAYQVTVSPPMPHSSTPSNPGVVGTYNGEDKLVSLTTARWTNNVTFPGLSAGVYDFTIAAVNGYGAGTSTPVQVGLNATPSAVTNLTNTTNLPARTNTVIWAEPTYTGGYITGGVVLVSPPMPAQSLPANPGIVPTFNGDGNLVSFTTAPWTRNVTFLNLPGTTYTVNVSATNAYGTGTGTDTVITLAAGPSTPANFQAAPSDTSATLTWDASTNPGGDLTYTATATAGGHTTRTCTTAAVTCDITGLTNSVLYTVVLYAESSTVGKSATTTTTVTPLAAPSVPPAPTAVAGNTLASITVAAGSGGGAPSSFTVTSSPEGKTCTVTGSSGSCDVTGLTNGTSYTFTATATNSSGTSGSSDPSNAVTPVAGNSFTSVWQTDNLSSGSSAANQVMLPLVSNGTYDFVADWGDDTTSHITTWNQSERIHTYAATGTYTVTITGTINGWVFYYDGDRLKILDVTKWGQLKLGNNGYYFYGAENLVGTATDALDLSGTTNMAGAFGWAYAFNGDVSNWDTSGVTDMSDMFGGSSSFNGDVSNWNTANVINMSGMFAYDSAFNRNLNSWNTSKVTTMTNMFNGCQTFNGNITNWDTSSVTDMSLMFYYAFAFNQDISLWNTAKVTSMNNMFAYAFTFNQPIGSWDTANVTDMAFVFINAGAFNKNLNSWNTSKVTTMANMFNGAQLFNQSLTSWNTALVVNMNSMFSNAYAFNGDISTWDTHNVRFTSNMFMNAQNFAGDLSIWDVSSVTDASYMFAAAVSFNSNISSWNTINAFNISHMFDGAQSFNQNLGSWPVTTVGNAAGMFVSTALSTDNYDALLIGWAAQNVGPSVEFGAGSVQYSAGAATVARGTLTGLRNWSITDGGQV